MTRARSRWSIGALAAVAALLGAAPAHAIWRTGHGSPPALRATQVCRNGLAWDFRSFTPAATRPARSMTLYGLSVVEQRNDLLTDPKDLVIPYGPAWVDPDDLEGAIAPFLWPGEPGWFWYGARWDAPFDRRVPKGAEVRVVARPEPGGPPWWWTSVATYTVDDCHLTAVRQSGPAVSMILYATPAFATGTVAADSIRLAAATPEGASVAVREPLSVARKDADADGDVDLVVETVLSGGIDCEHTLLRLAAETTGHAAIRGGDRFTPPGCRPEDEPPDR